VAFRDVVEVETLELNGPDAHVQLTATIGNDTDPKDLTLKLKARDCDTRAALRLWPQIYATRVRNFLVDHVQGGRARSIDLFLHLSGEDMRKSKEIKRIPKESLMVTYDVEQGSFFLMDGLPVLRDVSVSGMADGTSTDMLASAGIPSAHTDRSLVLTDGAITIDDFTRPDELVQVNFNVLGGAAAFAEFMELPAVKENVGVDIDLESVSGEASFRVDVGIPLKDVPPFAELPMQVVGVLDRLSFPGVVPGHAFEKGKLKVFYTPGDISVTGSGFVADAPVKIDVRSSRGRGEKVLTAALDAAARKRLGFSDAGKLDGVINYTVKSLFEEKGVNYHELDFAKAAVNQLIPGWSKGAGKAGTVTFKTRTGAGGTVSVEDISADVGSLQIRGKATLSADYALQDAMCDVFKIAPGDEMSLRLTRQNGVTALTLVGNTFDSRGLIRSLTKGVQPRGGAASAPSGDPFSTMDINAKLNIVTGFSSEALTRAVIKLGIREGVLRQVDASALLGGSPVAAVSSQSGGATRIEVNAEDAGRLLRFLYVYPRVYGGNLNLRLETDAGGEQSGVLKVDQFVVRDESALNTLISRSTAQSGDGDSNVPPPQTVNANEVAFRKARAEFTRKAGRLTLKDVVIFGSEIGFTLSGVLDYARDRLTINGTFIPAYGLNNAIANVPLFGVFLGGGVNEGLVGVNFRVGGSITRPVLSVSPLSAMAPGILRKIFGEIEKGGPVPGALPPPLQLYDNR
jgi:hypothetical protein